MTSLPPPPLVVSERSYSPEPGVDRHPFYQAVLPERGRLEMQIAGERGFAGEARFALIAPGVEHRYWAHGPNRFLILDLAPELLKDIHHDPLHRGTPEARAYRPLDERLVMLTALLRTESARGGLAEPLVAESLGRYAASLLWRPEPALAPSTGTACSTGARRLALLTRDYLETAYLEPLSISRIAAEVGASASHMQRAFRSHFGVTIIGYLQARRLERARTLLLTTDLSITEVAFASGFHDHGYFTRRFTREQGVSPSAYRTAMRAESGKDSR